MLLLIDAGNTRIKWALTENGARDADVLGRWIASGAVERADIAQLADAWRGRNIARVLLSNVAGQAMRDDLEQLLLRALGPKPVLPEWFKSVPLMGGVRNGYRNPAQLGCDRFAAAIGAHAMYPGRPLIVVRDHVVPLNRSTTPLSPTAKFSTSKPPAQRWASNSDRRKPHEFRGRSSAR